MKIDSYKAQNNAPEAIRIAWEAAAMLGFKLPIKPGKLDVLVSLLRLNLALRGKEPEDIEKLPEIQDKKFKAASTILVNVASAAFTTSVEEFLVLNFTLTRLSLKYGMSAGVGFALGVFGMIVAGALGDVDKGVRFGEVAERIIRRYNGKEFLPKIIFVRNLALEHWKYHLKLSLTPLLNAYKLGKEVGDLEYASYAIMVNTAHNLFIGTNLFELEKQVIQFHEATVEMSQELSLYRLDAYLQIVQNLLGKAKNPGILTGMYFNEEKNLEFLMKMNDKSSIGTFYINKIFLVYQFELPLEEQLKSADAAISYLEALTSVSGSPMIVFYDGLIRIKAYEVFKKKKYLRQAKASIKKFKKWAEHGKENYLHKYYLLMGEYLRVSSPSKINNFYEKAIEAARENSYINEEALAYRLGGNYYSSIQKQNIADYYNQSAYALYEKWGAVAITQFLEHLV